MPTLTVALLHKFLVEGGGKLSKRARDTEFSRLSPAEVLRVEQLFAESDASEREALPGACQNYNSPYYRRSAPTL